MTEWVVYIIRCRDQSLYTGITTDLARRCTEHAGSGRGAKALRGKTPLKLVWSRKVASRSEASRMEHWIKQMSKEQKEGLVLQDGHAEDHWT